ncbi:glycosyltransferase [Schinkia azotoformans]|uniref:Protein CgeB n=1 Tax=Schinkia azotoformans LMG 9581 TaxID=1131731 RepID=K6DRM2_SCHAZ|nr:glycosyltransferase [Schinkia azotoformans]EKN63431.1 protein CgeB [Schinkia azotoformans LMG 9581]MEC1638730.1 glycosyltransferase [Schinkia azotoformans]MEC1719211.1 glycosyltransferase [Schinkia azotoformans]MEC1946695.1 glycosyltransferase [Schinkia azotoformans]MED4413417.1 glycosyltransferase [Schinkia azotoformans]
MKFLLISSGYLGIYPYLEQSISDALLAHNVSIKMITPNYNLDTLEQIESFQPDFVLAFAGYNLQQKLLQFLKQKKFTLGIWFTEDPFYIDESIRLAEEFQYIFTIDLGAYEYYRKKYNSKKILHLPLGTDQSIYHPTTSQKDYLFDLCLIGYPYPERIQLANYILEQTPYKFVLGGPLWRRFINSQNHQRLFVINKWIEPKKVNQLYCSSKIILNSHRSPYFYKNKNTLGIESKSINVRTFDVAASGGFQLLSAKPDTVLHFDLGKEIICYSTDEECLKLIQQFLNNDQERTNISKKAMEKALNCHTFFHRVENIINSLS